MRHAITLICAGFMAFAAVTPAAAQVGYDRRGGDYTSFPVRTGDPAVCAARCEHDGRCRAWSFSFPRTLSPLAACRLKSKVPPREEDACCVSGVRGAGVIEPRRDGLEYSIDRLGGDYRSFETPLDPTGEACRAACNTDARCRAFTYVRPGYIGASARCYLKSKITRPHKNPCCISGVVR
ncbi:MAG TPA: PAN domain-containing protein [Pseudolabrys sp.]|nr:PAN domain-containing protein [Pseudolabrys sp.]